MYALSNPELAFIRAHGNRRRATIDPINSVLKKVLPTKQIEHPVPVDVDDASKATIEAVRPNTMTSPERLFSLIQAVEYVVKHGISGSIVECGTWHGSMMAAALTLQRL